MSARSFAHSSLALALALPVALGACTKAGKAKPEAEPANVERLAMAMVENSPTPAAVKECTPEQLSAGASLTMTTVLRLAKQTVESKPERADWINPAELDAPPARTLLDDKASTQARRQAAAELLAAPSYTVYRVDMVNVPLALEVKELKRGAVGMRAIGYDKTGAATCATVFMVQNDKAKSEWAMDKSDRARVDPEVAKALREDLKVQLLARIAQLKGG